MSLAATIVVPTAVALLSITVSLDLAITDFRETLTRPKPLALGLMAQLLVLPMAALVVGLMTGDATVMTALLLVALVPSGPTSNYIAAVGRGDLSLSVLMTVFGTLLSVLTLPLALPWMLQAAGQDAANLSPPVVELLKGLALMVLAPVSAGVFLARRFPAAVRRWRPAAARVATGVFALLVAGALVMEWRTLSAIVGRSLHWVLLLNLAAMVLGTIVARAAGLPANQRTVFAIKCALQNVSIALGIAIAQMHRMDIAAVAALYGLCQLLTASGYALWRRRDAAAPAGAAFTKA